MSTTQPSLRPGRILLVGCAKSKRADRAPARELYDSPLWRARRAHAVHSGCFWFIVSAKYGLLHPNTRIDRYDLALKEMAPADRRAWGVRVASDLEDRLG